MVCSVYIVEVEYENIFGNEEQFFGWDFCFARVRAHINEREALKKLYHDEFISK